MPRWLAIGWRGARARTSSRLVDHYTLRDLREGQTLSYNGERWAIESIEPFEGAGPEPYAGLLRAVRDDRAREV